MMHEHDDAPSGCTWHDKNGARCGVKPIVGSAKRSLCAQHMAQHNRMTLAPGDPSNVGEEPRLG